MFISFIYVSEGKFFFHLYIIRRKRFLMRFDSLSCMFVSIVFWWAGDVFVYSSKSLASLDRNIQMLLSSLQHHTGYYSRLFSGPNMMPSISQIQKLIEQAWRNGFDLQVCASMELRFRKEAILAIMVLCLMLELLSVQKGDIYAFGILCLSTFRLLIKLSEIYHRVYIYYLISMSFCYVVYTHSRA